MYTPKVYKRADVRGEKNKKNKTNTKILQDSGYSVKHISHASDEMETTDFNTQFI